MKLYQLILISFFLSSAISISAESKYSKIVIFRNEKNTENVEEEYKIYANDVLTTSLKNNHFEEFYMISGNFKLKVNKIYPTVYPVECSKSQTCYFRINRDLNLPGNPVIIEPVDSIAANEVLKHLKSDFAYQTKVIKLDRPNGFGLILDVGVGLDKVDVMNTTESTLVFLSFGGGAEFGLNYSYQFSNYFGCSMALSHQFNGLTPGVDNASVDFNRNVFSSTPYFIIPVIKRNSQGIKIGGGLDYYFNPNLNIKTTKIINGFSDEWKYKNTFGYHLIANYTGMISENLRGYVGLKYSDVQYEFSSGRMYSASVWNLMTPNGSAMSMDMGFEYRF